MNRLGDRNKGQALQQVGKSSHINPLGAYIASLGGASCSLVDYTDTYLHPGGAGL